MPLFVIDGALQIPQAGNISGADLVVVDEATVDASAVTGISHFNLTRSFMQIKSCWLLGTVMLVPMLASTPASANAFELKIGSIVGGNTSSSYAGWIDASSFSWGVTNAGSSAGGGSSHPAFRDFAWDQGGIDSSVVPIFLGVATGQHYATAELDVVRPGGGLNNQPQPFFEMIFGNAMLTSLRIAGAGDGDTTTASASLDYTQVTMRYRNQLPSGLYGAWIEGAFSLVDNAVTFSGDANVLTGLFESGGTVNLAGVTITPVPEPASWALMFSGLGALGWATRRRAFGRG